MNAGRKLTSEEMRKIRDHLLQKERAKHPGSIVDVRITSDEVAQDGEVKYVVVVTTETEHTSIDLKI